ncbi:MAG TPA: urease accessory UreF family protein [Solirubrobacteraceae bacterium]|jgi:urease accessory protein|nr:urease accessory UreF family protein [Solirubrobacteraceae bacterium]
MSGPSVLELVLADARTPSGGHAHSGGLEAALQGGLAPGEVAGFLRARLRTVGRCEAALAFRAAAATTLDELLALDLEAVARTPAEPLRRATRQLGRGLLRTAATWWPDDELLAGYRVASEATPRPVALGAIARAGGVSPSAAARLSLYDDAATVAAAAVKLLPLDAAVASGWLVALGGEIEALAASLEGGPEAAVPSTSTPLLDRRALVHAGEERRLFAS